MTIRRWILIGSLFILAGLVVACYPNPQPAGLTPVPTLAIGGTPTVVASLPAGGPGGTGSTGSGAGVAAAGAGVFQANCTACHGTQGQGVSGPALRNNQTIASGDQAVFNIIAQGVPNTAMPAWLVDNGGPLSSQQINNVVAFLHTLQNVPNIPSATPAPEEATETPPPANAPTPEPARPSNEGNPGQAVSLTGDAKRGQVAFGQICAVCHGPEGVQGIPNPGSEDGSVPPLNPIDPTIVNADPKVFATNIDLFIEHGSVPDGENPKIIMPNFGDSKLLEPQQIADIIAYVISLNQKK